MGLFGRFFGKQSNEVGNDTSLVCPALDYEAKCESQQQCEPKASELKTEQNSLSVSQNVPNAATSPIGLYPHELLMLSEAQRIRTDDLKFHARWRQEYDCDPAKLFDSLFDRGYIVDVGKVRYTLSEKVVRDKKWIEAVAFADRHAEYGLTIWALCSLMCKNPQIPYRDIYWKNFDKKAQGELSEPRKFNVDEHKLRLEMQASFLLEEKRYMDAAKFYAQSAYLEMNEYWFKILDLGNPRKAFLLMKGFVPDQPCSEIEVRANRHTIERFRKLVKKGSLTEDDLSYAVQRGAEAESMLLPSLSYDLSDYSSVIVNEVFERQEDNTSLYASAVERLGKVKLGEW